VHLNGSNVLLTVHSMFGCDRQHPLPCCLPTGVAEGLQWVAGCPSLAAIE